MMAIVNLGLLGFFKYGSFVLENVGLIVGQELGTLDIVLPIGISFYTFQLVSYVVDVYRGDVPAQKSFSTLLLYVRLFHQCIAGPIVRYKDICAELLERRATGQDIADGIWRFSFGLAKKAILAGEFTFHKVGSEIRVLEDINSFVSFTEEMNKSFASNQVIRVLDQFGNDIAVMFNDKYNGNIQNDPEGRISYWGDLDKYNKKMQKLRAIKNYNPEELVVEEGEEEDAVMVHNPVQPTRAMAKCYMTVYVI